MQIVKQSDDDKLEMFLKCNKVELAKMLIQANKLIKSESLIPMYQEADGSWRIVFGMERLDGEIDLSKEEYVQIYISSEKSDDGFGEGPDGRGFYPVSTIGYYRTTKEGKKTYFTDADSGEQDGLASSIPEEVQKILVSFGLGKRRHNNE